MSNDNNEKWFDGLIRSSLWPAPPTDLSSRVLTRIDMLQAGSRRGMVAAQPNRWSVMSSGRSLAAAMICMFLIGAVASGPFAEAESVSVAGLPYYSGFGSWLVQEMAQ
jgi:hypothetical protein